MNLPTETMWETMVAEVIQMPDWRGDRERYRATRRNALLRSMRVPTEFEGDFERLKADFERLAALPATQGELSRPEHW